MRIIKFIDKLLNFILILFFMIIILFSGYALYDVQQVYSEAELSEDILKYKPQSFKPEEVEKFDLSNLQNDINDDICGWIRIDGTNIDYPILFSSSMTYYLDKDYKKNYSAGGSIFLNGKNDRFFSDDYEIIYGHNMVKNLMFSDINKYENLDYFKKNNKGVLYTENDIYSLSVYTFNIIDSSFDIAYRIDEYKNGKNTELINNFENSAIYKNNIDIDSNNKFVLLSTCYNVGTPKRAVLFCKLDKVDTSSVINYESTSDIQRDEKENEKEKFNNKKIAESRDIRRNLEYLSKKEQNQSIESSIKIFFEELLLNPSRIALYILILFTAIIYIIIIYKKISLSQEEKQNLRIYNSRIEKYNIKRIFKLLFSEKDYNSKEKFRKNNK